ncbi:hypothetical protein AV530_019173 [Patagioenas fasciata monilis]|uniref:Sushi domain-containing protein n=1 Tax=Patagioenas fasciata monilis TaxID=372326 RepID=A0A1V4KX98_PATFA|nr:hypothetical protein AV530_019173 [Patagioenas fasciata monilis]
MIPLTDLQFGARATVFCDDGYKLVGSNFIQCQLKGNDVEWSKRPTCELITCSSPPRITNGKHDGEGVEKFVYNSTVTYSCDYGFQLVGNKTPSDGFQALICILSVSRGNGIRPSKKALTWEKKLSLYKKSLQNTISFSRSASFSKTPVSRGCAPSASRFVVPLYKTQSYYSPGTRQGSMCLPKYTGLSGILPQAGCFGNLNRSKIASFCGTRGDALTPILTLFHTSAVVGGQEKPDMAEMLLQQIPHPLQRILLPIKRLREGGSVTLPALSTLTTGRH